MPLHANDIAGQLHFLHVAPMNDAQVFDRFISKPMRMENRDRTAVVAGVLRALLSRKMIRHNAQKRASGAVVCELPPRKEEVLHLEFDTQREKRFHDYIEDRALRAFAMEHAVSPQKVLSKHIHLMSLFYSVRQACSHPSNVDVHKMHERNTKMAQQGNTSFQSAPAPSQHTAGHSVDIDALCMHVLPGSRMQVKRKIAGLINGDADVDDYTCPICTGMFTASSARLTPCGHMFCADCMVLWLAQCSTSVSRGVIGTCPLCVKRVNNSDLTAIELPPAVLNQLSGIGSPRATAAARPPASSSSSSSSSLEVAPVLSAAIEKELREDQSTLTTISCEFLRDYHTVYDEQSTTTRRLMRELSEMFEREDNSKAVIFSQFERTLETVRRDLDRAGIRHVHINGSLFPTERAIATQTFESDPEVCVFLLTARAGAVGLNLTAANHCFLLDVCVNPGQARQAIGRIHRLGQTREVVVKHFALQGTCEQRLLDSRAEAASQVENNSELTETQRIKHMKMLFGFQG